jgi:hypothetical protein
MGMINMIDLLIFGSIAPLLGIIVAFGKFDELRIMHHNKSSSNTSIFFYYVVYA